MKAVYLVMAALVLGLASGQATRNWDCARKEPTKVDCLTQYMDILWRKTTVTRNFTGCVIDDMYHNMNATNCLLGTEKMRIICPSPPQVNATGSCRIYKFVSKSFGIRTYNTYSNCVSDPKATPPNLCNCALRSRIDRDPYCADIFGVCSYQARLDRSEASCFSLFAWDPFKVACDVNLLHEIEV
jgi:hypothetical protein